MKKLIVFCFTAILLALQVQAQMDDPKSAIDSPKGFSQNMHNMMMSKKLKKATHQRDSLFHLSVSYQKDTTARGIVQRQLEADLSDMTGKFNDLSKKHKGLQNDYTEMNNRYTDLLKSSLNKTEQLNLALRQKEDLLNEREQKLAELEALLRRQDSLTEALNDLVKKALFSFNNDELTVEMRNGKVYVSLSDKLLFKSGSSDVEDKGKDALRKLADVLNKNTDIDILIEGHTDNIPIKTAQFSDNWDLSTARATNIVRILTDIYKVTPKRMTAAGRGEFVPRADNATSEGRAKNRRTEIILTPRLDELYKMLGKRK